MASRAEARRMKAVLERMGVVPGGTTGRFVLVNERKDSRVQGVEASQGTAAVPFSKLESSDAGVGSALKGSGNFPRPLRCAARSPRVMSSHFTAVEAVLF